MPEFYTSRLACPSVPMAYVHSSLCLRACVHIYVCIPSECPWEWCVSSRADQGPLPWGAQTDPSSPELYTVTLHWTATYGAERGGEERPQLTQSSQHLSKDIRGQKCGALMTMISGYIIVNNIKLMNVLENRKKLQNCSSFSNYFFFAISTFFDGTN